MLDSTILAGHFEPHEGTHQSAIIDRLFGCKDLGGGFGRLRHAFVCFLAILVVIHHLLGSVCTVAAARL